MAIPLRIDTIYAFIAQDENGDEGICGMQLPGSNTFMPFVGADLDRVKDLKPLAQQIANETGKSIKLVHFTTRNEVEEIKPSTKTS